MKRVYTAFLAATLLTLASNQSRAATLQSDLARIEAVFRANRGTRSGHDRSPKSKFCLINVFLPGEYGDNEQIWLEFMTSAGSSFMPFPGGDWWRFDPVAARLEFRFEEDGKSEAVTFFYDPATLKFQSAWIRNTRTGPDGVICDL